MELVIIPMEISFSSFVRNAKTPPVKRWRERRSRPSPSNDAPSPLRIPSREQSSNVSRSLSLLEENAR